MNEKAFLLLETGTRLPCLFNPSELRVRQSNRWTGNPLPGRGAPSLRFAGVESGWLAVTLFFDTTSTGNSVTEHTAPLLAAMQPDPSLPGSDPQSGNVRPPWVVFHWGRKLRSFKAVVRTVDLRFTYFGADGTPLRALAAVELAQFVEDDAFAKQNPTSGTPEPHKVHRVAPGETLDRIAAAHYGDPTRWRAIAEANGVDDPLTVAPGRLLAIPRADATAGSPS
jgi:hypothetical protein